MEMFKNLSAACIIILVLTISSCGQKGPLYILEESVENTNDIPTIDSTNSETTEPSQKENAKPESN